LTGGAFTDRGVIVGKVFVDENAIVFRIPVNLVTGAAVPRRRTFVITDSEANTTLRPASVAHVVKVDRHPAEGR
jgi:hypothetical protein